MRKRGFRLQPHTSGLVVLGLLSLVPVFASIPLITDETGTQGKNRLQLGLLGESGNDKEEAVQSRNGYFSATLSYGSAYTANVVIFVPYVSRSSDSSGSVTHEKGFSDLAVEEKWSFHEREGFSLALKPCFTFATGDPKKDLGNGEKAYYLFFIASREVAPWAFDLNLAYLRNNNSRGARENIWHALFASNLEMIKDLKLAADIGIKTIPEGPSNIPPAYSLAGAIYSIRENFDIGLGLEAGLTKSETDIAVRGDITHRL